MARKAKEVKTNHGRARLQTKSAGNRKLEKPQYVETHTIDKMRLVGTSRAKITTIGKHNQSTIGVQIARAVHQKRREHKQRDP